IQAHAEHVDGRLLKKFLQAAVKSFRIDALKIFNVEGSSEQGRLIQSVDQDFLRLGTEIRHGHAFLIGDIGKKRAISAGNGDQPNAALMLLGTKLGAGEKRGGIDQIVEIVDDDRAMLLEKSIPGGGGAGELAGVGDDVALSALGLAGAQDQHALAIGNRAVKSGTEAFRLLRRGFKISRNDVDLVAFRLVGEIIGGIEHDLVAAAGADMKTQAALGARVHDEIHHAAALKNAANVSRAQ